MFANDWDYSLPVPPSYRSSQDTKEYDAMVECPDCNGQGQVDVSFVAPRFVHCTSCAGKGVVTQCHREELIEANGFLPEE